MDTATAPSYQGCRFPVEIIAHCVWLYFRFCLSFRDVQEMMLERGVRCAAPVAKPPMLAPSPPRLPHTRPPTAAERFSRRRTPIQHSEIEPRRGGVIGWISYPCALPGESASVVKQTTEFPTLADS